MEFIEWKYKEIQEAGSDELKLAIEIITGGHEPGKAKKESDKHEQDHRH